MASNQRCAIAPNSSECSRIQTPMAGSRLTELGNRRSWLMTISFRRWDTKVESRFRDLQRRIPPAFSGGARSAFKLKRKDYLRNMLSRLTCKALLGFAAIWNDLPSPNIFMKSEAFSRLSKAVQLSVVNPHSRSCANTKYFLLRHRRHRSFRLRRK
jgi:hypothetical protein